MAIRDYASEISLRRKNRKNDEEENKSFVSNSGTDYASEIVKRRTYNSLSLDTLGSDLTSVSTKISEAYSGWQTQETMRNTKSSVESVYNRLLGYQDYQTKYGNGSNNISDLVDTYKYALDNWDDLAYSYSGYKSADDWKMASEKSEAMKTADLGAIQKEITDIEGILSTAKEYSGKAKSVMQRARNFQNRSGGAKSAGGFADEIRGAEKELNDYLASVGYGSVEEIEKALGEKKVYHTNASRMQNLINMSSVGDVNSENYDKDFNKYVESGKKMSKEKEEGFLSKEYKNHIGYLRENPDLIEAYEKSTDSQGAMLESILYNNNTYLAAKYMTAEEYNNYSYYLGKGDAEGAKKYLDLIGDAIRDRQGKAMAEENEGFLETLNFAYETGLDQFVQGTMNNFNNADYIPTTGKQRASARVGSEIQEEHGKFAKAGYDIVTTGANMLPSILAGTVASMVAPQVGVSATAAKLGKIATMAASSVPMFASARGNAYQEMLNLGYSKEQASTYGNLVGASEVGLNALLGGISKLGTSVTSKSITKLVSSIDNGLARFAIRYPLNMASEGIEEGLQEVLTPTFKNIAAGYDTGEKVDWGNVAYSALLGGLLGGVFEAAPLATEVSRETQFNNAIGKNIKANERVGDILNFANNPEMSEAYETYTQYAEKGINADNISDYKLGNLYSQTRAGAEGVVNSKKSTAEQKAQAEGIIKELDVYAQASPSARTGSAKNFDKKAVKKVYDNESTVSMIADGLESAEGTESHKLAVEYMQKLGLTEAEVTDIQSKILSGESLTLEQKAKIEGMKSLSADEIVKLSDANDAAIRAEENASAVEDLVERGESKDVAELVARKMRGEILTTEEASKVAESDVALQYVAEQSNAENVTEELLEMAKTMPKKDAALFVALYDGKTDMEAYANAFNLAVAKSENNFSQDDIFKSKSVLSNAQVAKIYEEVRVKADKETEVKFNKTIQATADKKFYKGSIDESVIDYDNKSASASGRVNWKDLDSRQRQAITFMNGFAKATGINLVWIKDDEKANGKYNRASNTLYLDVYAGIDHADKLSDTIIPTASHEVTHWMEKKSPELFRKINNLVFSTLKEEDGKSEWERIKGEMAKTGKSEDVVRSEIIARACEDVLSMSEQGKKIFNSLSKSEQKTFVDKIKEIIQDVIDWVSEMLGLYKSNSKEAQALRKHQDALNELVKLWDEALVRSVEVNQALEKSGEFGHKNTAEKESGKRKIKTLLDTDKYTLTETETFMTNEDIWVITTKLKGFEDSVKKVIFDEGGDFLYLHEKINGADKGYMFKSIPSKRVFEALNGRFDNDITSIGARDLTDLSGAVDTNGEELFQYRAMVEDEAIYREMLLEHMDVIGITKQQINDLFETIDKAVDIISNNLKELDYAWEADINDRAFSPVKPNSDSLYKVSLDFSTLCRKRLLQQTIQQTLQNALNMNLSTKDSIAIRDELIKIQEEGRKIEVACALCYVESARMKSPKQITRFLNEREAVIKEFFANRNEALKPKIKEAELKARETLAKNHPDGFRGKNDVKLDALTASKSDMKKADADFIRAEEKKVKASYKLSEQEQAELDVAMGMTVNDFTSAKGLESLAKNHPDLFDAYTSFIRNATHSKGIESDTWWRAGDSDSIGDSLIAKMNEENGLRSQSWSDFQVIHLLDYIAATIELSTKGAKRQSYTKVPDYVKLLGNTGDMINLSLIPENVFNGKLSYDGVEGMAYDIALKLRDEYHATVGTICIGINDEQIRMLLADNTIDYVIPYHHSSMSKATRKLMHIPAWESYEKTQSEKKLEDTEAKAMAKKYGVTLDKEGMWQKSPNFSEWFNLEEARQIAKMENEHPSNIEEYKKYGKMYGGYKAMQNAANNYLRLCAERGLAPKFSMGTDFTQEANYWKLLIDRKMVDNITGEVIEQKPIKPIFNEKHVLEILTDELERYPQVKADQEYAVRKVTEKFLSGEMKVDASTLEAIKKPIDNVTEVNILESSRDDVDLSEVITKNMSESERANILRNKKIANVPIVEDLSSEIIEKLEDVSSWEDFDKLFGKDKRNLIQKLAKEFGVFKEYKNSDINLSFEFSGNNYRESYGKQKKNFRNFAKMFSVFDQVIESAIGIEVHKREDYKPDATLDNVYVLISAFEDGDTIVPVKLEVKEFKDKQNTLYVAISLEAIKKTEVSKQGTTENSVAQNSRSVTISITDIFSKINPLDENFLKYIPSEFLNEEQIVAKNKALGTDTVLYSERDDVSVYDLMGENERIKKQNEKFKAEVENLRELLAIEKKVTNGNYITNSKALAAAGVILKRGNSNYDKVKLAKELKGVYEYLAEAEGSKYDALFRKCYEMADNVLREAKEEKVVDDYFKGILKDIRTTRISLDDMQKQEAKHLFGDHWNRSFMGKVVIAEDGTSLDSQWQEWAGRYPEQFSADVNPNDQIGELYDIINTLQESSESVVEYDVEERRRWLAQEIFNTFWNIPTVETTADKYDKRIKELKAEHKKSIAKVREEYNERLDKQKMIDDMYYGRKMRDIYRNIRKRTDAEVAMAKAHGREMLEGYKERSEKKTKIQSITSIALRLNDMLVKNNKDKHIHEALKGPVANLINAINFSSKSLLEKGKATQKDISLQKALRQVSVMMHNAGTGTAELIDLYGHGLDADIERMVANVDDIVENLGGNEFVLQMMSLEDLKCLDMIMRDVRHAVLKVNEFHVVQHKAGVEALGWECEQELAARTKIYLDKDGNEDTNKHFDKLKTSLFWNNTTPYYAFKHFGKSSQKMFAAFQDAQDKMAFLSKEVVDESGKIYTAKEYKKWAEQYFDFTVLQPDGKPKKFSMNVPQIMSLYCVYKQDDAKRHIHADGESGGITLVETDKKAAVNTNIRLSPKDVQNIIGVLGNTAEVGRAKEVADKLQEFMGRRGAELGNEISMARWGIKSFGIEDYFPIKVSAGTVNQKNETPGVEAHSLLALLNMSFTHSRNEYADQSVEIGDVFDIFANHMSDMIRYNAMAMPIIDMYKWMNIRGTDAGKNHSIETSIKDAFGNHAWNYINTFMKDVNGSTKKSTRDKLAVRFFRNAKVAKVAGNIRVALLQFTSFVRAGAVMDNKYLLRALFHFKDFGARKGTEKAKKYCGIALWKSLGYYDTDITRGLTEQIKHDTNLKDKIIEKSLKGAEKADEITWGTLWNACEMEVRETRKDLKIGSEEFYKEIGLRLRDIVYRTQVVDSMLTRSQLMRSPDSWDKVLTTFASESALSLNLTMDTFVEQALDARSMGKKEAWKKNGKYIRKTITAFVVTNVVTSALQSVFDAFRDHYEDDKDEEYWAKLMLENFVLNTSFLNKLPYFNTIISIFSGFSASRLDVDWATDVSKMVKELSKFSDGKGSVEKAFRYALKTLSDTSGIAAYNVYRDIYALYELFADKD